MLQLPYVNDRDDDDEPDDRITADKSHAVHETR